MRMSEDEPAAVVLARLRANEPRAPQPPAVDTTFGQRWAAWKQAVVREEVRAEREERNLRAEAEKAEDQREEKAREAAARKKLDAELDEAKIKKLKKKKARTKR